jgi:hypothetical protein
METWKRTVLPTISESYNAVAGGAYSLQRAQGEEGKANQFFSENVLPTFQTAYNQGMQNQFTSAESAAGRVAPAATTIANMPAAEYNTLSGAAANKYGYDTNAINASIADWTSQQPGNSDKLKLMMQYLGIPMTNTVTTQGSEGIVGNLLGAGIGGLAGGTALTGTLGSGFTGSGALLGAMILSDARAKNDIEPLSSALKTLSEISGKTYKYKGTSETRAGLVAQEVEKAFPVAVKTMNGIKHVDIYAIEALLVDAVNELNRLYKKEAA